MGVDTYLNAFVYQHEEGDPWRRATLVVEEGKVLEVDYHDEVRGRGDAVDLRERFVIPGLIDMHAHIYATIPGEFNRRDEGAAAAEATVRSVDVLSRYLRSGVTTIRDVGAGARHVFAVRRKLTELGTPSPDILLCGRGLAITAGHGAPRMAMMVDEPEGFRRAVREQIGQGAEWIKLMVTGGVGDPYELISDIQMSVEEIRASIEEAHRWRRRVTAHVGSAEAARICVEAGIDCIEHGLELDPETAALMAERGVYLCPTVEVYHRIAAARPEEDALWARSKSASLLEMHDEAVRNAYAAGVRIVTGTDSGMEPWTATSPWLAMEVAHLRRVGVSPVDALNAATSTAAECLGEPEIGRIAEGMRADFVVLDDDPLRNADVLKEPELVVKRGRRVGGGA